MGMTRHTVVEQRDDVADHAAPSSPVDPTAVAQYASALLPAVLWLLGVYVFDGAVPVQLQGAIGLAVTALSTGLVRFVRGRI